MADHSLTSDTDASSAPMYLFASTHNFETIATQHSAELQGLVDELADSNRQGP
jgi:hypothetical protein